MFAALASDDDDVSDDATEQDATEETAVKEGSNGGCSTHTSNGVGTLASGGGSSALLGGIDPDDIAIAIDVLHALAKDLTLFRSRAFKELREAVGPLAHELVGSRGVRSGGRGKRHASRLDGLDPVERLKQMDRDALNTRVLRAERIARLEAQALVPDEGELRRLQLSDDAAASLNAAQGASLLPFIPDGPAVRDADYVPDDVPVAKLNLAVSCYICKRPFQDLHHFYAALCPSCAELNWQKRDEMCNLHGRVALVTGGRIKIGLRIVLKLLRCGAIVIATTRFPKDAARRYAAERDFSKWFHRLHIVGVDLRDLQGLERLCAALPRLVNRLDIIINNACQTVRRPPQYYKPLLQAEAQPLDADAPLASGLVAADYALRFILNAPAPSYAAANAAASGNTDTATNTNTTLTKDGEANTSNSAAATAPIAFGASQLSLQLAAKPDTANDTTTTTSSTTTDRPTRTPAPAPPPASRPISANLPATNPATEPILAGMTLPVSAAGRSAALSQLPMVPGDETDDHAAFPTGRKDGNSDLNQQLDLRATNSWMLKLEEVSTPEMAEVLAVNALAPAIINGRLRAMMEASKAPSASAPADFPPESPWAEALPPTSHDLKFIVNVSAMEGRFYKYKQPTHPHTNMAKAALNMMTRTSAADYAKARIYMTAVDTGWINDEKPAAQAAADARLHNFQTPIDEIDAAARVLDPIIAPLRRFEAGLEPKPPYGQFLKDYEQCEW